MGKVNQSESGKAWEYGLARVAADIFSVPLTVNAPRNSAQRAYDYIDETEQRHIDNAASEAIVFLRAHDNALNKTAGVSMQSDMRGREGDVRDVIVHTQSGNQIGISAKHRHKAVKHPRLSLKIDFGYQWYQRACSEQYRRSVAPIFNRLSAAQDSGKLFKEIPDKAQTIYAPIIRAFIAEVRNAPAEKLWRYMLGKYDYYKIVKDNGNVILRAFSFSGSLGWGQKLPAPQRIIDVEQTRDTTAVITFDRGWSMSFRLHNAEKKAMPTLKFDVNLIGTPELANHSIQYG